MSAEFTVKRVSDRTHEWSHPKGGKNIDYWLEAEDNSGTELWVTTTRKADSSAPSPGEVIYGHTEAKTSKAGKKYLKLTRDQRPDGAGASSSPPDNAATGTPVAPPVATAGPSPKGDEFWAQKDARIARAGVLQAVVASGVFNASAARGDDDQAYVAAVNALTDALLASLDERNPHPNQPTQEVWDYSSDG